MKKPIYIIVLLCLVLLSVSVLPGNAYWRHHHRGTVWIEPGWGVWDTWFYPPPPVVIQQGPPVYVQPPSQSEEQSYWYYCQKPQGYYPYVKRCPGGWQKVAPSPVQEDDRRD